ncbi:MAG: hypothetical protein CVU63_24795, partial [Deltaproteobacteria bacterium HGW-Deltaproteobacteria-20]
MDETAARLQVCSPTVSRIQAFAFAFVGAAAALAASLPCPVTAEAAAPSPPLLDVQQLKPGDKGYGLTVFSGTEPERFDVEVIGVLSNFLPHQDLILVKTDHPRLQVAKVVAGMSGSPVFINGKMVGAYAYGWQFGEESVAGVTPIGAMLDELRRPIPPEAIQPLPGTAPAKAQGKSARAHHPSGHRFSGIPTSYSVEEHARQVAALHVPAQAGRGDALQLTDDRKLVVVLQVQAERPRGAVLQHLEVRDVVVVAQQRRQLGLELRRGNIHALVPGRAGVADAGQHIRDRI